MSLSETREYVPPDPQTPKTFGVLNLVFSLGLLASSLCYGFYAMLPPLASYANEYLASIEATELARKQGEIEDLKRSEDAAVTEVDRAEFRRQREAVEARPKSTPERPFPWADDRLRDPRYLGYFLVDLASGMLLNLALLVSGVGLVYAKEWGRRLAIAVAWLKIARLLGLALSFSIVVAPVVSSTIEAMDAEAAAADPGAGPASPELGPFLAVGFSAFFWVVFLVGSIYPALILWFLNRESVREACRAPS